ncbi:hypothetical protein PHPALM_27988 [Phytophthora palmivora]|uniref:ZSWIM1/3 RNaseH-like domain-containing protein n=1 Tax=Phytophthora palmivora TaxID=4796 RepID=A0A2P4XBB1_9STRA|nr:hypothetical protein PHPALM_27988 [Phytophthora palmivora]
MNSSTYLLQISYQCFPVRSTTSVEKRNKQISTSKKAKNAKNHADRGIDNSDDSVAFVDDERCQDEWKDYSSEKTPSRGDDMNSAGNSTGPHLIPASWNVYSKTLKCTHGIKHPKRGNGQRTHRVVRFTDCTAQVNATLVKGNQGLYYIYVKAKGSHNHALSPELWDYYLENRRIQDPLMLQTVSDMRETGSSAKGILAYLHKSTGKKTTLRDVHNILQSIRGEKHGNTTDATRVGYVLREFIEQKQGNSATIFVEEVSQVAHVVVFQSARMKRLFQAFPEMILVDTTHGTNANHYKLFSFMVTDFFGKGQYVQHALVKAETKDKLRLAIKCFQSNNPFWKNVKVFVTDKAFHEKSVLAEMFPGSRQLLCIFHVVTWLEKQPARLSTGTTAEKENLKAAVSALVFSTSEEQYEHGKQYLLKLLGGDEAHEFYRFFLDNWDDCRDEWVLYLRGNVPHLGNNTNNKLESKWGKIKQVVAKDFTIDELISTLIVLQEFAEGDYLREYHKVGSCPQTDDNRELSALGMTLSPFAFDLVTDEFRYATGGRADYGLHILNGMATLESRRTHTKHTVNIKSNLCNCIFRQTFLLPCRHVFFFRLLNQSETVLPPYNTFAER